jgi:hypothetical protein
VREWVRARAAEFKIKEKVWHIGQWEAAILADNEQETSSLCVAAWLGAKDETRPFSIVPDILPELLSLFPP